MWLPTDAVTATLGEGVPQQNALATDRCLVTARPEYIACVDCGVEMSRQNVGFSGIIVDRCGFHGAWFDAGELAALIRFYVSRGMTAPEAPKTSAEWERELGLVPAALDFLVHYPS